MAFVKNMGVRYVCPICGKDCDYRFKDSKEIGFEYPHADEMYFVNGYPQPCENNGRVLERHEIDVLDSPVIVSGGPGVY